MKKLLFLSLFVALSVGLMAPANAAIVNVDVIEMVMPLWGAGIGIWTENMPKPMSTIPPAIVPGVTPNSTSKVIWPATPRT